MPKIVRATPESAGIRRRPAGAAPELVPRGCRLEDYVPLDRVPSFRLSSDVVAYVSPDSTFAVTRRILDAARRTILIGIYDFSAEHVRLLLQHAMSRGVRVQLMLDIDSEREQRLFQDLQQLGADCTPAPSCASKRARYFRSSHLKVIVVDDTWTLVQSGNYSDNSIPLNGVDGGDPANFVTGNRDAGLAIRSRPLAKFFRKVLERDIALELAGPEAAAAVAGARPETFMVEAAPERLPARRFASRTFRLQAPVSAQPVLSPENYLSEVPRLLAGARRSIHIEQQYIRASQPRVALLLRAIASAVAAAPQLDVRIVLGKVFGADSVARERANLAHLADQYGLRLGTHIRYIDTTRFVHCHNKLVIVDGTRVLVGSQNWSDAAVAENREAGVLLSHPGIARYFAAVFASDWQTARRTLAAGGAQTIGPEALRRGRYVRVAAADYAEV